MAKLAQQHGWSESEQALGRKVREASWEEAVAMFRPAQHPALDKYPSYWFDTAYDRPLQPVVGICVFGAEAYVRWLSHVSGQAMALPTEQWWETAARDVRGLRWSYGDEPNPLAANTLDLRLRRTSPVGAFARHDAAGGWSDLSGNVWEWTQSPWTTSHKTTDKSDWSRRVIRGGTRFNPMRNARGACRYRDPLDIRLNLLGFRVCVPSPQSEF